MAASEDSILIIDKECSAWGSFHRDNVEQLGTEKEKVQQQNVTGLIRGRVHGWRSAPVLSMHHDYDYPMIPANLLCFGCAYYVIWFGVCAQPRGATQ